MSKYEQRERKKYARIQSRIMSGSMGCAIWALVTQVIMWPFKSVRSALGVLKIFTSNLTVNAK